MENLSCDRGIEYGFGKLAETWLFYEPMSILASQVLPMGEAVIVVVVIEVMSQAIKAHGTKA